MNDPDSGQTLPLPAGVRSRWIDNGHGLNMHVLEAGDAQQQRPLVVLLHGFPELAYTWRKVMPSLAEAGYHVVAPDQRGYGLTTGWQATYDGDLAPFRQLSLVWDVVGLVTALGYRAAEAVVGHDIGSPVAAYCALARPDMFRSVALMSAPFAGPPVPGAEISRDLDAELAVLDTPRKHYQHYFRGPDAAAHMDSPPQGLHNFLRAYFHVKSADWPGNDPFPLADGSAGELARMPYYYVMERDRTMPETVADEMPSATRISHCQWLPDHQLAVYTQMFQATGFQGGLQWYRAFAEPATTRELRQFSGQTLDVPSCFIAGEKDWGIYQSPGRFEHMQHSACSQMRRCTLIEGAGHWVQQEQPQAVTEELLAFLSDISR